MRESKIEDSGSNDNLSIERSLVRRSAAARVNVLPRGLAEKLGSVIVLEHFLGSFLGEAVWHVSHQSVS